jgi:hypothetical protein
MEQLDVIDIDTPTIQGEKCVLVGIPRTHTFESMQQTTVTFSHNKEGIVLFIENAQQKLAYLLSTIYKVPAHINEIMIIEIAEDNKNINYIAIREQ